MTNAGLPEKEMMTGRKSKRMGILWIISGCIASTCLLQPAVANDHGGVPGKLKIKITFGHKASQRQTRTVILKGASPGLAITGLAGVGTEQEDVVGQESLLHVGGGDVDALVADISWPPPSAPPRKLARHKDASTINDDAMWGYLMTHGSAGQSQRLKTDPWKQPDAPMLTVQLNEAGTEGFSIALEQLLHHGAMWLPEQDVFITLANKPASFKKHLASLKGQRILDKVESSPDASLDAFRGSWEDIGNPLEWTASWQTKWLGTTGHLTVTAPAHGAIYKFAVDRWGNVRPDFASPHKFRLDLHREGTTWKRQYIENGLPVIVTQLEKDGQLAEITQFAAPMADPAAVIRGYLPGVMLSKVKLSGKPGAFSFGFSLHNEAEGRKLEVVRIKEDYAVTDKSTGDILLLLQMPDELSIHAEQPVPVKKGEQAVLTVSGTLRDGAAEEIIVKLPSPAFPASAVERLQTLDFATAKEQVTAYWEHWLSRGALFKVPEEPVNQLIRASLWHSLILPRHTIADNGRPHMDLPYANTAYGQRNADWPVNQSVYVDYMIYGLRGYDQVAHEELEAMFRSQQQPDGRIGGFANWGVYSPAQLYAIAQNYLLSANGEHFEVLLPDALKTLDWCIRQVAVADSGTHATGLIRGPLNDLTHDNREWAFTQAYYVGGLELFAKALAVYGHPRADSVAHIAAGMKEAVVQEFARSSVQSPVVQLEDGTWINFVPTDAMTPRRLMEEWYPSDVDCGPLHLSRLGVIDANSWMTTAMLHDHEDNLFLKNLGAANEPVYVQQATAYLRRDEPKAAIRAFYSLMACGFSHEQLTSLEHRWAWGQYYGPPSTDGAWFELLRNMLITEPGADSLLIGQAIPRRWLEDGKQIEVRKAPTWFGPIDLSINSHAAKNEISASLELSGRKQPGMLIIRFRHPDSKPIRSVTINGRDWKDFDSKKEFIRIPAPEGTKFIISAKY